MYYVLTSGSRLHLEPKRGAFVSRDIKRATWARWFRLMKQDGTTALMAASVRGHKTAVDALLKHGASVDQQNLEGHTALMFAYNGRNQVRDSCVISSCY